MQESEKIKERDETELKVNYLLRSHLQFRSVLLGGARSLRVAQRAGPLCMLGSGVVVVAVVVKV